jgi:mono/diheme cytochrome c family protein
MPRFDARYLSDEQLQAIHRYLASIAQGPSAKDIPQLRSLLR